ncbi:hypothetical protein CHLRE_03g150000v5 [Chlamydomonas reinhardtii]|uniref:Uncharacterized protein n=1 Tax=Chlamydomonas reinhardtii TaxID=3055 RepID=A0A2K3DVL8_CHLRE|nr:uncharacterized protein CHLRE_03g150000v5 [Chlamydomonas reinhardtii]PNW84583.1 hypothetical protein CHLRE_03g150000v5 [Chlamydomonas reinhardtii]
MPPSTTLAGSCDSMDVRGVSIKAIASSAMRPATSASSWRTDGQTEADITSRLQAPVAAYSGAVRGPYGAPRCDIPRPPAKRPSEAGLSCGAQDVNFPARRAASGGGGFPAAAASASPAPSHSAGGYQHAHPHGQAQHSYLEGPAASQPHCSEACALRPPRRTVWAVRSAGGACPPLQPASAGGSPRSMPPRRLGPAVTVAAAAAAAHYRRQASCPPLAPALFPQYDPPHARARLCGGERGSAAAGMPAPTAFMHYNGPVLNLWSAGGAQGPAPHFLSEPHTSTSSTSTFVAPPHPTHAYHLPINNVPAPSLVSAGHSHSHVGAMDCGPSGMCACYDCLAQHRQLLLAAAAPPLQRPASSSGFRRGGAASSGVTAPSSGWGAALAPPPQHIHAGTAPGPCACAECMSVAAAGLPAPLLSAGSTAAAAVAATPFLTAAAAGPMSASSSDTEMASSDGDTSAPAEDVQYQAAYDAAYAAAYRAAYRAVRSAYISSGGGGAPPPQAAAAAAEPAAAVRGVSMYRATRSDYVPGTPSQRC